MRKEPFSVFDFVGSDSTSAEANSFFLTPLKNKWYEKVINSSSNLLFSYDLAGRFTSANNTFCNLLKLKSDNIIGKTSEEIGLTKQFCKTYEQLYLKVLKTGSSVSTTSSAISIFEGYSPYQIDIFPFHESSGEIIGIGVIAEEKNNKRTNEEILEELNDQLKCLVEANPYPLILKDNDNRWLVINQAAEKMFNLKDHSWYRRTDMELAKIRPKYASAHVSCMLSNEKVWESGLHAVSEDIIRTVEISNHQFQLTKIPVYGKDANRKGLVIIGNEITKTKEEEERLRLLEAVVTNATEGIIITEAYPFNYPGPKIIYVNEAYLTMTGYSKDEVLGQTPRMLQGINTDRDEIKRMHKAIANGESCKMEVINYKKTGEEFWSSISIAPVFNIGVFPTHWIGIKRDITAERKKDQEVKKAIITAQENEKQYIGRELHDNISQILVGALLYLGMVKPETDANTQLLEDTKKTIQYSIREIRKLSHHLAPAEMNGNSFIGLVEELLKSVNLDNKYSIVTNFSGMKRAKFNSEIQLNLYRIIQEQLQNIIKHAKATSIELNILQEGNKVRMRIVDNGRGFRKSRFTQGIGLQNIQHRAEIFSGTCAIRSAVGKGCEIDIEIPIAGYL